MWLSIEGKVILEANSYYGCGVKFDVTLGSEYTVNAFITEQVIRCTRCLVFQCLVPLYPPSPFYGNTMVMHLLLTILMTTFSKI